MRCKAGMLGGNRAKAWELPSVRYVQSFHVASQTVYVQDVAFGNSGLSMYVTAFNGYVYQYTLAVAWDVSTASYSHSLNTNTQGSGLTGVAFKTDGTKLFVASAYRGEIPQVPNAFEGQILEYLLGTAWDISTATYTQEFVPIGPTNSGGVLESVAFSDDGVFMFVADGDAIEVRQYILSTAWSVSTASPFARLGVGGQDVTLKSAIVGDGGRQLYTVGQQNDRVQQYRLSTPYDVSTAVPANSVNVFSQDGAPTGLFFKEDGLAMFVSGDTADRIYQYSLV